MPQLKYEQIADHLRARITEGEFGPGDLLPSGRDLCEQWGVSRATVVKAMDVLRNDGVVVARQGSGFTVVETPVARPAGRRGVGPRVSGGRPFKRLGTPCKEVPPDRIRDALHLGPETCALRRDRMVLLDEGEPYTLVSAWFPADIADACPRLAQEGPIAEGTTRYVTRETGRAPARATDIYTTRLATSDECKQLGLPHPAAVAVTLHTAYDQGGRPLVCEEGVTGGELWELTDSYSMES
ncbi:GntR family transcriptional regulator [Streptomyces sp. B15]|uniref:GntR family transcriptional regulator n=1 Tax=Streptomyces sp. B15 TaxID=1537797 RepID=UPI001B38006E|nr:GntR family transcriptional regulator [Streptomyces sp. B15]MBQ1122660.1 GntR family transcriptional regulator [Streptomyces sp. B15]